MKKNNFLEGAMISTVGIVLCKIIGLLYVIPFYAIIGTQGSILYGYAYSIYAIFLSLSSTGIPVAISKIVSEYSALGFQNTKERAYKIGKRIIVGIGLVSCAVLFLFAPQLSYFIIGNIEGGNSIESITMVIRVISSALLFVPVLSVAKGYLQGNKIMGVPSIANVIEQIVRVVVIIAGSFLSLKVFHVSLDTAVGIAVFGATIGAFVSYFYVADRIKKNRKILNRDAIMTREEAKITGKDIAKKIIFYAFPFILIDIIRSAYSTVDTFTVVKTLVNLGFGVGDAENVTSVITTWASKLNMIITSVSIGFTVSLIPNIASSFIKKDYEDGSRKINQTLQLVLYTSLPMTLGLSFLAGPAWTIFYGYDPLSIQIFAVYIFQALIMSFYLVLVDTTQTLNNTKVALGTLGIGFILKLVLNIPFMHVCAFLGIPAYYGPVILTILIQLFASIFLLGQLHKHYHVKYKKTFRTWGKTLLCNGIMMGVLLILSIFFPPTATTRQASFIICAIYAIVGIIVYLFVSIKSGLLEEVFGKDFVRRFSKKKNK